MHRVAEPVCQTASRNQCVTTGDRVSSRYFSARPGKYQRRRRAKILRSGWRCAFSKTGQKRNRQRPSETSPLVSAACPMIPPIWSVVKPLHLGIVAARMHMNGARSIGLT